MHLLPYLLLVANFVHVHNIELGFEQEHKFFLTRGLPVLNLKDVQRQMSLFVRKQVFEVSDQVRHKPGCTATEDLYLSLNTATRPRGHFRQVSAASVSIRQEKIKYRQRIKSMIVKDKNR